MRTAALQCWGVPQSVPVWTLWCVAATRASPHCPKACPKRPLNCELETIITGSTIVKEPPFIQCGFSLYLRQDIWIYVADAVLYCVYVQHLFKAFLELFLPSLSISRNLQPFHCNKCNNLHQLKATKKTSKHHLDAMFWFFLLHPHWMLCVSATFF